jgi:hypothetical protein
VVNWSLGDVVNGSPTRTLFDVEDNKVKRMKLCPMRRQTLQQTYNDFFDYFPQSDSQEVSGLYVDTWKKVSQDIEL